MRIEYTELKDPLKLEQIVFDKLSRKNAKIISLIPLILQLDEEPLKMVEREPLDLEYYIWTKEDIDEIYQSTKRFSQLLE